LVNWSGLVLAPAMRAARSRSRPDIDGQVLRSGAAKSFVTPGIQIFVRKSESFNNELSSALI
jgi:hypothetical protein